MFYSIINLYSNSFKTIVYDFPGHGKSDRLDRFETDFWFYNAQVANALLEELKLNKVDVIGTSGGALVGINLALENPEKVKTLMADSFEGESPLASYVSTIKEDRENAKQDSNVQAFWRSCHGEDWRSVVDNDTKVNIEFAETYTSFFHKSISELKVPTLITGSMEDEFCSHLDKIYEELRSKNPELKVYIFEKGNHPAMLSNRDEFFELTRKFINEHK
ncbi:MAG: alpha/beta hydrolase [Marinilabiliales bacterium]|nr:MAG: alpha/beta hydrolase [Marinilabiliales bacterium]